MPIFSLSKNRLSQVRELKIDLEKDLQKLTEENLQEVFGLKFISSEFPLQNFRIDTLAFDEETQSFVIIEYKRDRSFSVVDQGFTYLALLLNNKDSFVLEFVRKTGADINSVSKIDWSRSKVVFLANSFTVYQQNAINFRDLPIELWEVKKYSNDTILYNQLKSAESSESINTVSKNKTIETVSKQVKKNNIEDHFKKDWTESRELFELLRTRILDLDNRIEENPNPQSYIGYKIRNSNVLAVHAYKSKLMLALPRTHPKDLDDPQKKATLRLNSIDYYNQHITDVDIKSSSDIEYAIFLANQVYERTFRELNPKKDVK